MLLKTCLAAAFALGGVLTLAAPASARAADPLPPQVIVHYSDLDLTRAEGVALLNKRVNVALAQVCDVGNDREISVLSQAMRCRATATRDAHDQVQNAVSRARAAVAVASR